MVSKEAGKYAHNGPGEEQQAVADADYFPPGNHLLFDFRRAEAGVEQAAGGQHQQRQEDEGDAKKQHIQNLHRSQ